MQNLHKNLRLRLSVAIGGGADKPLLVYRMDIYISVYPLGWFMGTQFRQKMVSLDEKSMILASRMTNFSEWVRMALLEYARSEDDVDDQPASGPHVAPERARVWGENKNKCNPKHIRGMCPTCWGDA